MGSQLIVLESVGFIKNYISDRNYSETVISEKNPESVVILYTIVKDYFSCKEICAEL